ncbi:MAG: electron transport complex subunit RsxB [Xanthomonadales bacterium]|nr:electron transport complex subunit RsxB [Xanthomonadales bacterium]
MSATLGLLLFALLAGVVGGLLGWAGARLRRDEDPVVERINRLLPQTQCAQCGYPGCRPYAEAIARGEADINQCPPGGDQGVRDLAQLLGREVVPLDKRRGTTKAPQVAFIREDECIGCTKCIQACPVDAIVGAQKLMHTVIAEDCTGCELCLPPCPVDCIDLIPARAIQPFELKLVARELAPSRVPKQT